MLKVAIVGNIASGKSVTEKFLQNQGFPVLDTDKVCHKLLEELPQIKEAFKDYDVFENSKLSREKLGKLVFNYPELKNKLEMILYPELKLNIEEFFSANATSEFTFVAIPLLFEAGMEALFDKILFIYCDDDIRLKRLIERNGYSEDYARIRMDAQLAQDFKVSKADFVIYNNSTVENLQMELSRLIEQIR